MADSLEDRIQKLDAKKKALQAKLNRQKRTENTRKKILLGSLLMAHMEHEKIASWVKKELPSFLTREQDKKLFHEWLLTATPSEPKTEKSLAENQDHTVTELAEA